MKFSLITCSDTPDPAEDKTGQAIIRRIISRGWTLLEHRVVADNPESIEDALRRACDEVGADIVFTCGGTGLSYRDITPEATLAVATRNVPGITEAIRRSHLTVIERSMLSRAASVQRNKTLIINLPRTQRTALECFYACADQLEHAVDMMADEGQEESAA